MTYYLFAGDDYYPRGGVLDYISAHPTVEAAKGAAESAGYTRDAEWAQVVQEEDGDLRIVAYWPNTHMPGEPQHWQDQPQEGV